MLLNILFPKTCIFCGDKSPDTLSLCEGCELDLPWITHSCKRCALPLETNNAAELLCPKCQQHPPSHERCFALFHYQPPVSDLIAQLKFYHKLIYAKLFGLLLANYLHHVYQDDLSFPSRIIPMPLHKTRLQLRGFNQALEIARPLAKKLQIPLDYKLCQRIQPTSSQSSLTNVQHRIMNVKNAFTAENIPSGHVLIIDDVITTGSTVNELSKVLRRQGASRVDVACCARTVLVRD